jgi:hypothetical protein
MGLESLWQNPTLDNNPSHLYPINNFTLCFFIFYLTFFLSFFSLSFSLSFVLSALASLSSSLFNYAFSSKLTFLNFHILFYICIAPYLLSFLSLTSSPLVLHSSHVPFLIITCPYRSSPSMSLAEWEKQVRSGRKTALCVTITLCEVSGVDQVMTV